MSQKGRFMIKYGQTIVWTDFWGDRTEIATFGCDSLEEAKKEAIKSAKQCGWIPVKWWQWWRWEDTKIKEKEKKRNLT